MRTKQFLPICLMTLFVGVAGAAQYYMGSDGYADRVIIRDDGSGNAKWIVAASEPNSFGDGLAELNGVFGLITDHHFLGDINGDGFADRVAVRLYYDAGLQVYYWKWYVDYSTPTGFGDGITDVSGSFGGPTAIPFAVADLDGDGKDDRVILSYDTSSPAIRTYTGNKTTDGLPGGATWTSTWGTVNTNLCGIYDVNNDEIADRVDWFSGAGWRVDFGPSGGGFGDSVTDWDGYYGDEDIPWRFVGDLNGDGYGDRVIANLNGEGTYYNWFGSLSTASNWGTSGTDYDQIAPFGQPGDKLLLYDVLTTEVPDALAYLMPYTDAYGTNGLWHFDEIIESEIPDPVGGSFMTPDDDSENLNRQHHLFLYSGKTPATAGGGPQLVVDPIGDPNVVDPNSAEGFGKCMQFNGLNDVLWVNTLQGDDLGVDDSNLRVEAWVKFEGEQYSFGTEYFIVCHYQRFRMRLFDHVGMGMLVSWIVFDSNGVAKPINVSMNIEDLQGWNHIAGEFYKGTSKLYINGVLRYSISGLTNSIKPVASNEPRLVVGAASFGGTPTNYFLGKIDEVRISQAVPTAPPCGYWGYSPADLNKDCYVGMGDFVLLVDQWLTCTVPSDPSCIPWEL